MASNSGAGSGGGGGRKNRLGSSGIGGWGRPVDGSGGVVSRGVVGVAGVPIRVGGSVGGSGGASG